MAFEGSLVSRIGPDNSRPPESPQTVRVIDAKLLAAFAMGTWSA